jgi:hypothetical protein
VNIMKTNVTTLVAALSLVFAASADAQTYDHLQCFKIKDTKTFKKATADIEVLTGHLTGLQNCQISAGAKELCMPVDKMSVVVTEGTETPLVGQDLRYNRLCYKLKCPASTIAPQGYEDQFGTRTIDGFKVATICTPTTLGPPPTEAPPVWPDDPQDYTPGVSSYIDSLTLPGLDGGGVPTCCQDFGGKSKNGSGDIDNALALLADGLSVLGFDIQATLDDAIQNGELVLLLDHQNLNVVTQPDEFALVQLLGAFEGATDYASASAGLGTFEATQASFVPGSGEPNNWYHPAAMGATDMTAGPFSLTLTLPFGFVSLSLKAGEARMSADHGLISVAGVPYTNGELSGYVLMDEFFGNLNAILNSPQCACLGLTGDVYNKLPTGLWSGTCKLDADSLCTLPAEEVCVALADNDLFGSPPGVCGALPSVIQEQADIDLNSNTDVYEAMSVGLQFTAVNGQIVGVQP